MKLLTDQLEIPYSFSLYRFWSAVIFYVLLIFSYGDSRYQGGEINPINYTVIDRRLEELRTEIEKSELDGYIITPHDEHQNNAASIEDRRLEYITGFSGYYGDALVTKDKSVFWTDEKYEEQAKSQLGSKWIVISSSGSNNATLAQWLINEFKGVDRVSIGADPKLVPAFVWLSWNRELGHSNIELKRLKNNLVDNIWIRNDSIYADVQAEYYSKSDNKHWFQKIEQVRRQMEIFKSDALVLTDLSEIGWLFNMRGHDVPDLFQQKAFVIIDQNGTRLFTDEDRLNDDFKKQLNLNGSLIDGTQEYVRIMKYDEIYKELRTHSNLWKSVWMPSPCGFTPGVSMLIYKSITGTNRLSQPSPIIALRATKNQLEIKALYEAHKQDALGIVEFMADMTTDFVYRKLRWNIKKSVGNIAFYFYVTGGRSGDIHLPIMVEYGDYPKTPCYTQSCSDVEIKEELPIAVIHVVKNFKDATVDIARTLNFADDPGKRYRTAYTQTLIELIDLATTTFPANITIDELQQMTGKTLVNVEYDDLHLSGHGFSHFVSFNSCPTTSPSIEYTKTSCSRCNTRLLQPGQLLLNGQRRLVYDSKNNRNYSIKLENIMEIVATNKEISQGQPLLKFQDVSRVPFDLQSINKKLFTKTQKKWLNVYNKRIRNEILKNMNIEMWPLKAVYNPHVYLLENTRKV